MKLHLDITDSEVDSYSHPKGGIDHDYNKHRIYPGNNGWFYSCHGFDYLSAENEVIYQKLLDVTTSFEWKTFNKRQEHYRQEGVYEFADVKIVVISREHMQEIEFTGRSVDTFRRALVAFRNGEIHPKYPLVRKQEAPTYQALAETVSEQTKVIRRLVEQLETANKVVNHAQELITRASDDINNFRDEASRLEGMLTRLEQQIGE